MIFTKETVLDELKLHSEKPDEWVINARKYHTTLNAVVNGIDFHKELIERIEYLESEDRAKAREKYSKDIRDLFYRITIKRQNVFHANGTSENIQVTNKKILEDFTSRLSNFKANKSLHTYLEDTLFNLRDVDPNGCIMLEYSKKDDDYNIYPTYKSINDIRYYVADGQKVDYIIFEPKENEDADIRYWRVVDDLTDWTIVEIADKFFIDTIRTFKHPFGEVPLLILSEKEKTGTQERLSQIEPIIELAKEYAFDKSISTIYRLQKGHPTHYRFGSTCRTCGGTGVVNGNTCTVCGGRGYPKKGDVTDMYILPFPKEGQPSLPSKLMGFESPDIDYMEYMDERLKLSEIKIDDTMWGTDNLRKLDKSNETATSINVDHQLYIGELNRYSSSAEYFDNTFAGWVLNFVDLQKDRKEILYHKSYGRRYMLENPDVLNEKYQKAKKAGDNVVILDKLLEELILSKYKSDPFLQREMIKKMRLEPYVHLSIQEVNNLFGEKEAYKKVLFHEFWKNIDTSKEEKVIKNELEEFIKNKTKNYESSKMHQTTIEGQ